MQNLKSILLATGKFIDNKYLDLYIELVSTPRKVVSYMENHHIIPVAYYKHKYNIDTRKHRHEAERYANADYHNTIVALSFADHCKAHWLLSKCTTEKLARASSIAFIRLASGLKCVDERFFINKKHHIVDVGLTDAEYELLQQYVSELRATNSRFWSLEQDNWLKQNRHSYTVKECAKYLGKSENAVLTRCNILNIPKKIWYTEAENTELLAYSVNHTAKECAERFGTSKHNIIKRWRDLGFSKTFKWTEEQDNWLRENDSRYTVAELAEKLGTTKTTVMGRRWTLGITRWERTK